MEIKEIVTKNDEMSEKINLLRTQNKQEEMKLSESQSQNSIIKNELSMLNTKEKNTKKTNLELISEKEKLEKQSASLNTQLKTESELKEVYEQKISSLTTLLESLEKEYKK